MKNLLRPVKGCPIAFLVGLMLCGLSVFQFGAYVCSWNLGFWDIPNEGDLQYIVDLSVLFICGGALVISAWPRHDVYHDMGSEKP